MTNPWFRMYSEFANDPKVQIMSEAMQRRYIMLMCLRCSNTLVTLHETEIAFHLRISNDEMAETKALFISKGFIDEFWNLLNWDKRQFASDRSAPRVAKHRALQKEKRTADVTLQKRKSNALDTDTDTDTDTDKRHTQSAPDGAARASPSMAAAICMVLKAEGIASVNPGHPDLKALIDAGADAGMFASAGKSARERGKGFAYVLGTVRGQMRDAAATAESGLSAAAEKDSETPYQRSMRLRMEEVSPGLAKPAPGSRKPTQVVEIFEAPPLRLEA